MNRSLLHLAWRSVLNRRTAAFLTVLSIALSTSLFLGVEKVRRSAEAGFGATLSGTDLIVGARTGSVNLLLYSVFRIGEPTSNVSWESYSRYKEHPDVAWTVPLSLGDSHKNYRVLGTNTDYFEHYKYGADRSLSLTQGALFADVHDIVLGSEVAKSLEYDVGDEIILSHGLVSADFANHEDHPFVITGILARTGTPVDRTLHISLEGMDAIHADYAPTAQSDHRHDSEHDLESGPESGHDITAFLIGLDNRALALRLQRAINTDEKEALLAILPGVALTQLWGIVGSAQSAFRLTALLVIIAGLLGLMAMILTTLNERRRELAVLRATGATTGNIFSLLLIESVVLASLGTFLGTSLVYGVLYLLRPLIENRYGIPLGNLGPSPFDAAIIALIIAMAAFMSCFPAWRAYRQSLQAGLTPRL